MALHAKLRSDLESTLAKRIPGSLSPQMLIRQRISSGIPDIDSVIDGGLPLGAISELSGAACSGRTTLALQVIAQITKHDHVCAWIDTTDSFDPESAKANFVDLDRLLWVRCGVLTVPAGVQPVQGGTSPQISSRTQNSGPSVPHPKGAKPATPGALNVPLCFTSNTHAKLSHCSAATRGTQIPTDRLPSRRGSRLLEIQKSELFENKFRKQNDRTALHGIGSKQSGSTQSGSTKHLLVAAPWDRLDQALRATDLLMQSGGFAAVVVDLGGIAPHVANRIPLSTWFRFRAAADRTGTCFLLLTQHPCAQSSAEVSLRVSLDRAAPGAVMISLPIRVEVHRQRFEQAGIHYQGNEQDGKVTSIRKAPHRATAAEWNFATAWEVAR